MAAAGAAESPPSPPLVLILCGHCGVGKSSTANLLLGEQRFASERSAAAVTQACRQASTTVNGRKVIVVDTPGLTDPEKSDNVEIFSDIITGVQSVVQEFPTAQFALLLVMSLATRVDEAIISSFKELKRVCFGIGMYAQSCVVYTHGDLLSPLPPLPAGRAEGLSAEDGPPPRVAFCGECGRKATRKFCTGCGALLLGAAPPPPATAVGAATALAPAAIPLDLDQALATYLSAVGESVGAFLGAIKGASVVLSNPPSTVAGLAAKGRTEAMPPKMTTNEQPPPLDRASSPFLKVPCQLDRIIEAASRVAGPADLLAPPKRRGKHARRERQVRLAAEGRIGRASVLAQGGTAEVPVKELLAAGGLRGVLSTWVVVGLLGVAIARAWWLSSGL